MRKQWEILNRFSNLESGWCDLRMCPKEIIRYVLSFKIRGTSIAVNGDLMTNSEPRMMRVLRLNRLSAESLSKLDGLE